MIRLLALALLLPAIAAAQDVTALTASIGSYHLNRANDYCEVNPGIGLERGSQALRAVGGLYHNSLCRPSGYLGAMLTGRVADGWRAGGALLALTGYHSERKTKGGEIEREDKTLLVPTFVLSWEGPRHGLNIGFIPPESWARIIGHKEGEKPEKDRFKGLIFLQAKVLKW